MSDPATPHAPGKSSNDGKAVDPVGELRVKHEEALQRERDPRGSKAGVKRGPYKKGDGGSGAAGTPPPAAPALPGPSQESLNKKCGLVWTAIGNGLALTTNCNVWYVDAEQEKLLGEAYGDLCSGLGIADTLAVKIVFTMGVTIGIMGTKVALFAAYRAKLLEDAEKVKKNPVANAPKQPSSTQTPPSNSSTDVIHETVPGVI